MEQRDSWSAFFFPLYSWHLKTSLYTTLLVAILDAMVTSASASANNKLYDVMLQCFPAKLWCEFNKWCILPLLPRCFQTCPMVEAAQWSSRQNWFFSSQSIHYKLHCCYFWGLMGDCKSWGHTPLFMNTLIYQFNIYLLKCTIHHVHIGDWKCRG